ncbi:hypothetical protein LWF15_29035 [Kineosporia rhizophila]|uniref:hypothetical protein n=1 Tax=Kineosporia rhizophila TaxID=84633 RepID=UPI001E2F9EFD|nr:hypothetical protein [Kineosporia rhizophila]MCE0539552.1 hypothetical protein [Kineosporia rhizophila]
MWVILVDGVVQVDVESSWRFRTETLEHPESGSLSVLELDRPFDLGMVGARFARVFGPERDVPMSLVSG